jgi:hypothetical protein
MRSRKKMRKLSPMTKKLIATVALMPVLYAKITENLVD